MNPSAESEHVAAVVAVVGSALREAGVDPARPLLVAVSGGADSMTALDALQTIAGNRGPRVIACHFNHRMRGAQSDADEEYVRAHASSRGIEFIGDGADVSAHAREHKLSFEDAARRLRYGFLGRAAESAGAQAAATGHTLDDQAETVLLHIARGSGISGVRGMRLVSQAPRRWGSAPLTVIRPLLRLRREDTEEYCRERGIVPRLDVSNESTTFARNRLRLNVMPELEAINPRVAESIMRLSDTASEELAALQEVVDELWSRARDDAVTSDGRATVRRPVLLAAGPALRRAILRRAYAQAAGSTVDLTRTHLLDMDRLALAGAGRSLDLPGGLRFETRAETVEISPAGSEDVPFPAAFEPVNLSLPGCHRFPDGACLRAKMVERPAGLDTGSDTCTYADADAIGASVTLRNRRDGDRFQPLGMDSAVRLQDVLVNEGVPRSWRDRTPVVDSGRGVVWAPGLRIAHWARVTAGTRRVVCMEYERPV